MSTFLWVVFPYLAIGVFIAGMIWRYRYDKFGWTTRSSQIYESKLLRIGSPLFHYGILLAFLGHIMGLLIPARAMDHLIEPHAYHMMAVIGGIVSGIMICVGFGILMFRRRTVSTVFQATTVNDKVMYAILGLVIFFGMFNTISTAVSPAFAYRDSVSPWIRSVLLLRPNAQLMVDTPFQFQAHAFLAFLLLLIWPFTRLVHVFSVPLGYLSRPYIVYRSAGTKHRHSQAPVGTWVSPTSDRN